MFRAIFLQMHMKHVKAAKRAVWFLSSELAWVATLIGFVFEAVEYLFGAVLPLKNKIHRGFPLLVRKAEEARFSFSQ